MATANTKGQLTYRLTDDEIAEISQIAQNKSLAYAAKAFMKSASVGVTNSVAEAITAALADAEVRAADISPQDLQQYVAGLNMKWEWNTPEGTPVSKEVAAVLQPYASSSGQDPEFFPIKALQVGVGIEF